MFSRLRKNIRNFAYRTITSIGGDANGLVTVRTLRGPAKGLRFRLDLVRNIESHYWFGIYDQHILAALAKIIQPGWVVWDCGIYLGYYSSFFSRQVGEKGVVIAFEPDRYVSRTLKQLRERD